MRSNGILILAMAVSFTAPAQMVVMKTPGNDSGKVYLQKLAIDVKIAGTIATTTWTMTFKNKTNRVLEGELNFPLPAGISASRYALDINGHLREAVPVEKEKATRVFETAERRRIDPGLLEKVDGNTFRTRVYPIPPGGVRTILLGYEEDLGWAGSELRYRLPLVFAYPIEEFGLHIHVFHNAVKGQLEGINDGALSFDEWKDVWTADRSWQNYSAGGSLAIRIPKTAGQGETMMQAQGNHYLYVATLFPPARKIEKPSPRHITLLWDASLSGLNRKRKKELDLLDAYFHQLKNTSVTLVPFSNTVGQPGSFSVVNGEWKSLRTALENMVYDGATQFGILDLKKYPGEEFLLFSDGHSTFGSPELRIDDRPVYAVTSTADADFPFLTYVTRSSGGDIIDLDKGDLSKAMDQLLFRTFQFLGVKAAAGLEENYPSLPTPLTDGHITVTGLCYRPDQLVVMLFGYGRKVLLEQTVALDFSHQSVEGVDLTRVWAQKKIGELDTRYEDNRAEIGRLGKRYGIVTRNTSLIVLESVNDYVNYQIEPPADLREEYDRLMKIKGDNEQVRRQAVVSNGEVYFDELLNWWNGNEDAKLVMDKRVTPPRDLAPQPAPRVQKDTVEYNASSFRLRAPERSSDEALAGRQPLEGRVPGMAVNTDRQNRLESVTIRGYNTTPNSAFVGSSSTARGRLRDDRERLPGDGERLSAEDEPGKGSFTAAMADNKMDYLEKLKAAPAAGQYALYLQLREDHLHTPLFYYHTAGFFLASGRKETGLKILSNIAELETENYELYKLLGYKLKEIGEVDAACYLFRKIMEWRPFEPQSYRDYGLALEDAGHYQEALDTLCYALTKNYDANVSALYPGIEETLIPEINDLLFRGKGRLDSSRAPRNLLTGMPVDIRVVLNWNRPNTDIDLWVTDPDNEKCFYAHRNTDMGGRISHDFTRGLGPEQFLLKKAGKGKYKLEVNYYGDTQVQLAGPTTVMVEVYLHYGTSQESRKVITLQMQKSAKGAVYVGDFEF